MYMPQNTGGDFEQTPAGTHVARCYRVIDLGTQQVEWSGQIKHQRKVIVSWELCDKRMDDGRPFTAHQRYTFSSSEKSHFRKHLESWRGKAFSDEDFGEGGFDVRRLINVPCMLSVVHASKGDKTYANIGGVLALPKGMNAPDLENETAFLSLEPDEFDQGVFDNLSDNIKDTIRKSPEYAELTNGSGIPSARSPDDYGAPPQEDLDDEIPF